MAIVQTKFEGVSDLSINIIKCICGFCNHHDSQNAIIEFDFKEQKVFYKCGNPNCGKMNEMLFGKEQMPSLPRVRFGK